MRTKKKHLARTQAKALKTTQETLEDWLSTQFTKERIQRWLDGTRPTCHRGHQGHFQIITWGTSPRLWACMQAGKGGKPRALLAIQGNFRTAANGYCIELKLWKPRFCSSPVHEVVHFRPEENAPKKLNKAIRTLRKQLGV